MNSTELNRCVSCGEIAWDYGEGMVEQVISLSALQHIRHTHAFSPLRAISTVRLVMFDKVVAQPPMNDRSATIRSGERLLLR